MSMGFEMLLSNMLGINLDEFKDQAQAAVNEAKETVNNVIETLNLIAQNQERQLLATAAVHAQNKRIESKMDQLAKALNFEFVPEAEDNGPVRIEQRQ